MTSPKEKYNLPDNNNRSYWRGFSQVELDIMIDAIKSSPVFQIYLKDMGLDIRKFGSDWRDENFEDVIRRIIAEEIRKALNR